YKECSTEKQRLGRVIASLEDQLAEKQQAVRHLEEAGDEDRTERETKISLLERKLAEMEAAQGLHGPGSNGALQTREVRESAPADDSRSGETCPRCGAALAQVDQAIQSAIKREKEDQTLVCLYRMQDLLKGRISDRVATPTPPPTRVPSPSRDPSARVVQSPQEERETLRQRHQLVTEQLKGLFRQRQQLEQSQKQPGGGKEGRSGEPPKPEEVLVVPKSTRPPEGQPAAPDVPSSSSSAEVQSLQQLLKEKTEMISSMASEIQALQQKNESLMKAKLRFQQQIQQIRNLPKQRPERSAPELQVPRISVGLGQDLQSTQGSDSSVPSPQSDEPPFTGSGEDLSQAPRVSHHPTGAEDQRRDSSSDEAAGQMPPGPRCARVPAVAPTKPFSIELIPPPQGDNEGALLSPRGSALLSPRPFVPTRPWSPFKFRGNPELPENSEKH
ncbi:actin cytoskeleton-regulatory complex protein pan1-like, partial [Sphaerodactylus townsendi]|uniref:actin cytoskeleton-regulatory complex protein pan1-like n=1 Tax=Sphaerodactylus townsendi TaxID=933632 RepID=UPI002025DA63